MPTKILFLTVFVAAFLIFLPSFAEAGGTYRACRLNKSGGCCDINPLSCPCSGAVHTVTYDGLVPCGRDLQVSGFGNKQMVPCQLCHFFIMFASILEFIRNISVVIAVLMFAIAGFMYLFAGGAAGTPQTLNTAKSILTSTVWGLVIIFAAWIFINTIFIFIGVADWGGFSLTKSWFKIDCTIKLTETCKI